MNLDYGNRLIENRRSDVTVLCDTMIVDLVFYMSSTSLASTASDLNIESFLANRLDGVSNSVIYNQVSHIMSA